MLYTNYQPARLINQFQQDIQQLIDQEQVQESSQTKTAHWTPRVDIQEQEDSFIIAADLPGVRPDTIEISLDAGIMIIQGERKPNKDDKEENSYHRSERAHGTFYRRFSLPDNVNSENIEAKSDHGVLQISIPKQEKAQPKKITVAS